MRSLFLSPHSDDEALFGAFTILKYQPLVVICFESSGDYGDSNVRLQESIDACMFLGAPAQALPTDVTLMTSLMQLDRAHEPEIVWAPSIISSHPEHRDLAFAAHQLFNGRVRHYDTYTAGETGLRKVRMLPPAPIDDPRWIAAKYMALQCYKSQLTHPRAQNFFLWDLHEYAEQP